MDKDDRKEIIDNVNVIINCAASVDFNSRLDEAIKINVYGTLKMFYLAKESKNIENFVHVSTCYVNSDKKGLIQEKIYDISIDAEEYINTLYKKPINEVLRSNMFKFLARPRNSKNSWKLSEHLYFHQVYG